MHKPPSAPRGTHASCRPPPPPGFTTHTITHHLCHQHIVRACIAWSVAACCPASACSVAGRLALAAWSQHCKPQALWPAVPLQLYVVCCRDSGGAALPDTADADRTALYIRFCVDMDGCRVSAVFLLQHNVVKWGMCSRDVYCCHCCNQLVPSGCWDSAAHLRHSAWSTGRPEGGTALPGGRLAPPSSSPPPPRTHVRAQAHGL